MVYDCKKTVCMLFCPKSFIFKPHDIYLGKTKLKWVTEQKYLGVYICSNLSDECDIKRQIKSIYARGTILV